MDDETDFCTKQVKCNVCKKGIVEYIRSVSGCWKTGLHISRQLYHMMRVPNTCVILVCVCVRVYPRNVTLRRLMTFSLVRNRVYAAFQGGGGRHAKSEEESDAMIKSATPGVSILMSRSLCPNYDHGWI